VTKLRSQDGFTLIEVLVAILLSGIVFSATITALVAFQAQSSKNTKRNEVQSNARNAIDRLARQLRNVAAPTTGSYGALEEAEPYSITFQTIDQGPLPAESKNATNAMRVRYCLNDSTPTNEVIWYQVRRWTSAAAPANESSGSVCPDPSATHWDKSRVLAEHVTNRNGGAARPLFEYGPTGAESVTKINTVEPHLYLDLNPGRAPGETQQTTTLSLRNSNRQPVAAFTAEEIGVGRVLLNASESEDPDGLALSYKWFEGGKELATSAQQYETPLPAFTSKSSHTYTLEVSDPGGLTSSTSHTITIK
jgi:prepilin-type N-terminal cleavage/methylation domain-containing protein